VKRGKRKEESGKRKVERGRVQDRKNGGKIKKKVDRFGFFK
jgi:hypothetical protein